MALGGDSRAEYTFILPGGRNQYLRNVGAGSWLSALTAGVLNFPITGNVGKRSETTQQILAHTPADIASLKALGFKRIVWIGSTNDRPGFTVKQSMDNVKEIIRLYTEAGMYFHLISEMPRGNGSSGYELSTQGKADHYQVHVEMEALRGTNPRLVVHNVWPLLVDAASGTNYYLKAGVSEDQIHMAKIGSYLNATVISPEVLAATKLTETSLPTTTALYDALTAPRGSLTLNPLMTGVAGTKESTASTVTGAFIPTGMKIGGASLAGLTIACSQVQLGGFTYTKFDFSGTIDAATASTVFPLLQLKIAVDMTKVAVGDKLKSVGGVAFTGTGLSNVGHSVLLTPPFQQLYDTENSVPALPYPTLATPVKMSRESPTYTHEAAITGIELRMEISLLSRDALAAAGQTINCSVYFGQTKVFKV
jgi:hypothetical protein